MSLIEIGVIAKKNLEKNSLYFNFLDKKLFLIKVLMGFFFWSYVCLLLETPPPVVGVSYGPLVYFLFKMYVFCNPY